MKLRTWAQLSADELQRRRAVLKLILIVQAAGLTVGGLASTAAWLAAPVRSFPATVILPFALIGVCWLVYRWSERRWYPAVYLYLFSTLLLTVSGMFSMGGAQSSMTGFFAFIVFAAAMLVDPRAGVEWTVLSLIAYAIFAVGAPLGWITLPLEAFESTRQYTYPAFFTLSLVVLSLLILLFGNSLNRALEQSRRLAGDMEDLTRELIERNRQTEEANRRLQTAASDQQRRAAQLQAAADVSAAVTQIADVQELLTRVVQVIQQQFGFYYVGLFLLDDSGRYAVLHAGTGEPGQVMRERGHRLEIGGHSMVGWACANRQARIAQDVGQEAVRFVNPLLPDTRSEMALPLRQGDRLLGALTVQSAQVAAFDESDIAALQGMTDQIAIALENDRLFQQTQATLKELESTNQLLARQGWQGHLERPSTTRHSEFGLAPAGEVGGTPLAVVPDAIAVNAAVPDAVAVDAVVPNAVAVNAADLRIPLELRGQRLGQLKLRRGGERPWTGEEKTIIEAVALQTMLAADNARLVEQTQLALQETEGLFAAARDIAQAAQIQDICQSLASYVNVLEQSDRTIVTLVDQPHRQILARVGAGNFAGELDMTFEEFAAGLGGQVVRSGAPILSLGADDPNESQETRERRNQLDIGALFIVPLSIKGQIIGAVSVVNRTHQRKFNQRNVDLAQALAGPAATALENVRLLETTQRRAERERLIRQITTRIRAATDTPGVLETTATELAQSLGVPRAIVRLGLGSAGHDNGNHVTSAVADSVQANE